MGAPTSDGIRVGEGTTFVIGAVLAGGIRTVVAVILVFVIMVMIHEFGHFIVAKRAGVLVYRFAIGFGPRLFSFSRGETEYSIRLFPLGGYVMLAGEMPQDTYFKIGEQIAVRLDQIQQVDLIGDPSDVQNATVVGHLRAIDTMRSFTVTLETEDGVYSYAFSKHSFLATGKEPIAIAPPDRQMNQKPIWVRMAIALAGPFMNVVLAVVLFAVILGVMGSFSSPPQFASIESGSPAAHAGLKSGDVLVAVNHQPVHNWMTFVTEIQSHPKQPLDITVDRGSVDKSLVITPEKRSDGTGFIGVTPVIDHSLWSAMTNSVYQTGQYSQMITNAFVGMFSHGNTFVKDTAGPVKIVQVIGQQAQLGILQLLNLTAILSLNLAILNLLPIPPLDGSRILLLIVEFLRGRPIDPRKEYWVHAIGFVLIITLMVVRTYLDVAQMF